MKTKKEGVQMKFDRLTLDDARKIQANLYSRIIRKLESEEYKNIPRLIHAFHEISNIVTQVHRKEETIRDMTKLHEENIRLKHRFRCMLCANIVIYIILIILLVT
jgi:hypothetical protein